MKLLHLPTRTFRDFPEIKVFFVVGKFNPRLSSAETIISERKRLAEALGLRTAKFASLKQIHSAKAVFIQKNKLPDFFAQDLREGDALYTADSNVFLTVRSADCLPVLIYHKGAGVIAAVHAGFLGSAKQIVPKLVKQISKKFRAPLQDFYFYFGPAARPCCYEITKNPERLAVFPKKYQNQITRRDSGRTYLDFVRANVLGLLDLGIRPEQIEDSKICTVHKIDFPSHRREQENRRETIVSIIGKIES